MSDQDDDASADKRADIKGADILVFPQSRVVGQSLGADYMDLGESKMADQFGTPKQQQTGHWCSRCQGIWFGYLLEVECPKCGNRQG